MQPFDCLTFDDKELVRQWCINYANAEPQSIEQVLSTWNKNKKTLFRAFGKQLRISFPIQEKVNSSYRNSKWRSLYSPFLIYTMEDLRFFTPDPRNHVFINSLGQWLKDIYLDKMPLSYLRDITEYTKYCYIENGKTMTNKSFMYKDKPLKIPAGTKIMRAIRKVLEYFEFPYMDSFNQWRDDISVINTDKEINAELVFSIHPIDFMTMSDNKCGWTSCMSWIDDGGYSTGTIEMLNSNLAVVVYLQSPQQFIYNNLNIPNKSWRTLVFVHKDILLVGKHYPYQSEILAKIILDKLQEIVKKNLGWKYQYKKQLYKDMIYSYDNTYIREYFTRMGGHKIYTYTGIMYHDILEDHSTDYWCCRNWVPKSLYLNLSGPATCFCCGKLIDKNHDYDIACNIKYCEECEKKYKCCGCGLVSEKHAKDRVLFMEKTYWSEFRSCGCIDCCIDKYLWDSNSKMFILRQHAYHNDISYLPATRERFYKSNEICSSLSNRN